MSSASIDRRTFAGLAGASLIPLAVGCSVPTPPTRTVAERPRRPYRAGARIRIGVIGVGIRGRKLNRRLLRDERARVLAICDVVEARRAAAKAEVDKAYGSTDCQLYVDYLDLLARDDIDAVVIATPDHWHATQVVHAARAGLDIYCEKPLTHTLHEGERIIAAVARYGPVFQTGSQQRSEFGHRFVKAAEYVRNGRIGDVLSVHVGVGDPARACDLPAEPLVAGTDWDRWLGPVAERPYNKVLCPEGVHSHYPKWRSYWEFAGGGLADMGAHHFDIVQWALRMDDSGPIAARPPRRPGADRGVQLLYDNGVTVVHGGPSGATFVGTKGMIHVDRGRLSSTPDAFKKPLDDQDEQLPRNKDHVDDWLNCIQSGATPICTAEIGARSAAVCQLANLAYRYGREITWDPRSWRFAGAEPAAWLDHHRRTGYPLPTV